MEINKATIEKVSPQRAISYRTNFLHKWSSFKCDRNSSKSVGRGDDDEISMNVVTEFECKGHDSIEDPFRLNITQLEVLQETLKNFREEEVTKKKKKHAYKPAIPNKEQHRRSEIVLAPRVRILQSGFATYNQFPNGIVNFVRTDIQADNWRFCYVCSLDEPAMRYIRQLALTQIKRDYAGFAECYIFRIIKFCATCFQCYNEDSQNRLVLVKITHRAFNLFSPL